jgi:hypothetical protein
MSVAEQLAACIAGNQSQFSPSLTTPQFPTPFKPARYKLDAEQICIVSVDSLPTAHR